MSLDRYVHLIVMEMSASTCWSGMDISTVMTDFRKGFATFWTGVLVPEA